MSEQTGQQPTNPQDMTMKELMAEHEKLRTFEAHVSDLAYQRMKELQREMNYRRTTTICR